MAAMSSYEDYTSTSRNYDGTRVPIGVEIILGCLAGTGRALDELTLLDAGCGTGNYTAALVERVARVVAVDLNPSMLDAARCKLAEWIERDRLEVHQCAIDGLPLAEQSVDAVIINQVLHHVADDANQGWPAIRRILAEIARVLRPGGVLVINTCSHEQLARGCWYASLLPHAVEEMCARHVPFHQLEAMLDACGFEVRGRIVPADALSQGDHYHDGRGPQREAWRHGDSLWAMAEPPELAAALARLQSLDTGGSLEQYVLEHDARRPHIGQSTFIHAVRW